MRVLRKQPRSNRGRTSGPIPIGGLNLLTIVLLMASLFSTMLTPAPIAAQQKDNTPPPFPAPNAVVVGSTTAGADGNVSPIPLPGGLRSAMSGIGVFYPDKKPTQRIGIVADINARPTIQGIRSGRDEVLEAALRHILGPGASATEIERLAKR